MGAWKEDASQSIYGHCFASYFYHYFNLLNDFSCSSAVGRQGTRQYVSLGRGCMHHGIVVHEIGLWKTLLLRN